MQETATSSLGSRLPAFAERFREDILDVNDSAGEIFVTVKTEKIRDIIRFLKEDKSTRFNMMMDLYGVDYLKYEPMQRERFCVVYNLYSLPRHDRIFLKAYLASETEPELDSIHDLYKAANWFEREAWDLYGFKFKGHPNLIRILCHNAFVGHPLRKDYPADKYQKLKGVAPSSEI